MANFWQILANLERLVLGLYRSRILQVNTRLKALDEIYKIYTLLHRSAFKNWIIQSNFVELFSQFHNLFEIHWLFSEKFTNVDEISHIVYYFRIFYRKDQILLDRSFSDFLRFRKGNCRIFQKMIFQKLEQSRQKLELEEDPF